MTPDGDEFVDSHVHFWDRDRFEYRWLDDESETLQRSFLPEHLTPASNVTGIIAVQADCRDDQAIDEAAWLHDVADHGIPIRAVIAHAPLELGAASSDHLARLARMPLVAGVRRLLQGEAPGFALEPHFVEGVRSLAEYGFVMDLCVRESQLSEVDALVERCPEISFVLDHLGKPTIGKGDFTAWAVDLARLADLPNVKCKLSGLATEAPPHLRSAPALAPWLEHAIAVFGPERCMFGSDWPVVTAVSSYDSWVEIVLSALEGLTDAEAAAVLGGTASGTYDPARRAARVGV